MENGFVKQITWDGVGCSISMASTSVMSDLLIGKDYQQALRVLEAFMELMQSKGQLKGDEALLEDGVAFAGVSKFPARIKCALLGWMAFKDASAQVMA
jgi:nitrogen fixation NifU-like protein